MSQSALPGLPPTYLDQMLLAQFLLNAPVGSPIGSPTPYAIQRSAWINVLAKAGAVTYDAVNGVVVVDTSKVTGAGTGGWTTVRNVDLTALPTTTIPVNGTFAMGADTWTSFNSANSSPGMTLVKGTGLTITPVISTDIAGTTYTIPGIVIALNTIIPNWSWWTPFRVWLHIASQNIAANGDQADLIVCNAAGAINSATFGAANKFEKVSGNTGHTGFIYQGSGNVGNSDHTRPTDDVLILDYPLGFAGQKVNMFSGVMTGTLGWPAAALIEAHYLYDFAACLNAGVGPMIMSPFQTTPTSQQLVFAAGRAGSGTSLAVTFDAYRIDYIPNLP